MSPPEMTTKKNTAASADQFEDAEEEDEKDKKHVAVVKAEPPSDLSKGATEGPIIPTEDRATKASTKSDDKQEDTEEESVAPMKAAPLITEAKASTPIESPLTTKESGHTTPDPTVDAKPLSASSPLDALASIACVADERRQANEPASAPVVTIANMTKEDTRVSADKITCTDVLCGRGGQSNHHPGNIFFRRLVRAKQEEYLKANKREKTVVAKDIVKLIRLLSPPGRFLKKDAKKESIYVDVGDIQARNKASQALREGAPELREELRDQHSRMNAERGGGPDVKLPYHGSGRTASAPAETKNTEDDHGGASREAAAATAAHGMYRPAFAAADARAAAALRAKAEGKNDPTKGESADGSERAAAGAAAVHAAAEERARRIMLASMGQPGLGAHFMHPHFGLGGFGPGAMNPYLAGPSPAQFAAFGGAHMLSPQAMMFAAHQQPSAAALFHASRARDLAHQIEAANYAAASGMNPLLMGEKRGAAQVQDSMRLHEMLNNSTGPNSEGNAKAGSDRSSKGKGKGKGKGKRDREEAERAVDENNAKAAKLSRQYL